MKDGGGLDGCKGIETWHWWSGRLLLFCWSDKFQEKKERLYLRFDFFFNELKKKGF
jgi:hypothetical protein